MPGVLERKHLWLLNNFSHNDSVFSLNHVLLFVFECSRYRFGCREVAIDEKNQVSVFTANENDVTTISLTTSLTIALVS